MSTMKFGIWSKMLHFTDIFSAEGFPNGEQLSLNLVNSVFSWN